ncbi:MAG TPA: hypothetical protein PK280_13355 [Planctomycetota bacterium]|nr:hypothetical protein [Planctomycetota bacterium]
MRIVLICTAVGVLTAAAAAPGGEAQPPAQPAAEAPAVLDLESGSFRAFLRWKTPSVISKDGKVAPLLAPKGKNQAEGDRKPMPVVASAPPPAGWTAPDFDEGAWPRVRGAVISRQYTISGGIGAPAGGPIYYPGNPADWQMICLRGQFQVEDPAAAKGLVLKLRYHGGAVVYVNGTEVARANLPEGKLDPEALAEGYAEETYVRPDGKLYAFQSDAQPFADRMAGRIRTLKAKDGGEGVAVPEAALRKGVNTLAIEIHAAPLHEVATTALPAKGRWQFEDNPTPWSHAAVLEARLASASGAGLGSRAGPAAGIGLFTCPALESVEVWDYAPPADGVRPIRMVGAQNGSFSGQAVLSSAAAIRKPRATVTDLAGEGGAKIPAAAVQIRWAEPASPPTSFNSPTRFDRLLAEPPAEVAPAKISIRDRKVQPTPAAVAPVWVTVRVPADAPAGLYKGTLTVEADGATAAKFAVPVELKVHAWKVPDPKDFAVHNNLYQSPDTLAQHYKVPLWSDKHWELTARSFAAFQQLGNKVCVVNLAVKVPSLNNTESMIRWVKKGDGPYDYDYSVAEKYMDVYEKTCGKPGILELNVWGYAGKDEKPAPPLSVTVVDKDGKKLEDLVQPPYCTAENEAFWKPPLVELKKRLEKRGWYDVTAVCYTSYCWDPPKEMVANLKNIWPDGRWMNCTHSYRTSYAGTNGPMPVPFVEWVWGCGNIYNPDAGKPGSYPRPWTKCPPRADLGNPRYGVAFVEALRDSSPLAVCRATPEACLQSGLIGVGRVGGDFWPLPIGKGGKYEHICDSFAAVGPANNTVALTSAGPDGAALNQRSEMFREGLQVAEAIVFLGKAQDGGKLSAELSGKISNLLDERARHYYRGRLPQALATLSLEACGPQERDDRLFALCAEVAKAAGK